MEGVKNLRVLHLMTQDNQPYGSERRCCEICGTMIWTEPMPAYTDDRIRFNGMEPDEALKLGYVKCNGKPVGHQEEALKSEPPPEPEEPPTGLREKPGLAKAHHLDPPKTPPGRANTPALKRAILDRLHTVWCSELHHEQRLGQLLVATAPGNHPNPELFYVEDEELLQYLEERKIVTPDLKERLYTEAEAREMGELMAFTILMELAGKTSDSTAAKLEKLAADLKKKIDS